jgi:hypothetical protein
MAEHPADELIKQLEGIAIKTSQGSFLRMSDVRRLIEERQSDEKDEQEKAKSAPKTLTQARAQAAEYLKTQDFGPKVPQEPGRSTPASEPQPPSRA